MLGGNVMNTSNGTNASGIEREEKYFDIACRRIEDAYRQPRLFADNQQGEMEQGGLFGGAA